MRIRSITCFFDPRSAQAYTQLDNLAKLASEGETLFNQSGLEVQTHRLASVPFPMLYPTEEVDSAVHLAQTLQADALQRGFTYLSLGPATADRISSFDLIAPILEACNAVFISGMIATPREGLSLPAARKCAEVIERAAHITPDGFTNLRFGVAANVAPHGPFFPLSYHIGERPAFSIAVECADLALDSFGKADSLAEGRRKLVSGLENAATVISSHAAYLSQKYNVDFKGIDFSLAPYPQDWCSLGAALEALGLPALGMLGSGAAAAYLADTLDRGRWLRTGFNGLMLPGLEDSRLARRAAEGSLTVKDLLLYATMCGAGVDTAPLPGDATAEQLYPLLLDVAAIALRLNKPLISRLMPIPGKQAGDVVEYDFEYFASSRVLALPAAELSRGLAGDEVLSIRPRA
jgi:uncharacterized protein (UPF0210 family)